MPDVPRPHREDAEAPDLLHDHVHGRDGRHDRERGDREGSARDGRIPLSQPPARLPGLRPWRRVRVAGDGLRLGRPRRTFYRAEELRARKIPLAHRRQRPAALHPLQALHARLRRVDGRGRHRGRGPRRAHRHRHIRRLAQLLAVRQLHRGLPDGHASRRDVQTPDAPVGAEPHDFDLFFLFGRLPVLGRLARRRGDARRRARPLRGRPQRRIPLHQGPLRAPLRQPRRAPAHAARPLQEGRQARPGDVGRGRALRRREVAGGEGRARRRRSRRRRQPAPDERGELLSAQVRARSLRD